MGLLLAYENAVDSAAALTSDSEASGLGVSNVQNPIVGRRWRTTATSAYLQVDFGSPVAVDVLALVFPRDGTLPGAVGDTVRHRLDLSTAGAGAALDTGAVAMGMADGYGYHVHLLAAAVSARYWRVDLACPSLAARGYIDVGRAWAGSAWRPSGPGVAYGWGRTWGDAAVIASAERSGAEYVATAYRQQQVTVELPWLPAAEADALREIQRQIGTGAQVLFSHDTDAAPGAAFVLGRLAALEPLVQHHPSYWSTRLTLRESL